MQIKTFPDFIRESIKNRALDQLKEKLVDFQSSEIIHGIQLCTESDRAVTFRLLSKDKAMKVFELMDPPMQAELIQSFSNEETNQFIGQLEVDEQVRLLDELPARVAKRLLQALPKNQRESVAKLMGYADGTVGRIMSPIVAGLKESMTVKQAIDLVRSKKDIHHSPITTLYVMDETRKLLGVLSLEQLFFSDMNDQLSTIVQKDEVTTVSAIEDQEKAARLLQQLNLLELPVVDKEHRLVGTLTAEDAMDVIREEQTDDVFDKVGLLDFSSKESDRSFKLLNGSFWHVMKVRVPFLLITLAGGMAAGLVIDAFEEVLEAIVATAFFIPVIMDMGGNVGTQSSTIFTRAMVLGQINLKRFFSIWFRETSNGALMGIILGTIGGLIAGVWQGIPALGLAVGLSMSLVITLGVALGFVVPWVLIRMGFDQAAGADPIITTIKDISGLVIYFYMVSWLLPELVTVI
jgi:magnesium transporter